MKQQQSHFVQKRPKRHNKRWLKFGLIGVAALAAAVVVLVFALSSTGTAPEKPASSNQTAKQKPQEPAQPTVPLVNLQPTLDTWLKTQRAQYSIEVYDVANQKVIAAHNADTAYFTASLYKLYVAYLGYRNMTDGTYVDSPNYQGSRSRLECLDVMIKNSDSPCAEAMMAELGRDYINSQLPALGITHTDFGSLTTSAHDMDTLINDILKTKDISDEYKQKLLTSMNEQIYRQGLDKGFDKAKTVGSKVGFNLDINYHESSLVTLQDGRQYIVSVLSQGQGSPRPLADLASRLQAVLLEPANLPQSSNAQ